MPASMVFFVGNPTNVVICEGFAVNNVGFTAHTILPFLACSLSCFIVLAIQFRHLKYIPPNLCVRGYLDVRAVLHDPVRASVGGALLGTCLIVIIVVSFFNVQMWMISLPFAVSKFLWDLTWDTYRLKYLKMSVLRKRSSMDEEDDVMLRELKRWKTSATIITEESDLKHKLKVEIANAVASGAADIAANEGIPISSAEASRRCTLIDNTSLSQQRPSTPPNSRPLLSISDLLDRFSTYLSIRFPTFHTALPRLPFALVPFASPNLYL